ncbi:MAG: hypothetical protein JXR07_05035 [Reichenbachiella sp.]
MLIRFVVLCILLAPFHLAKGQGCSDAGFCTMGAMKPDQQYAKNVDIKLRSIELTSYMGATLLTPMIYSVTADVTLSITDRLFVQAKLPYQIVKGNLGETSGLSDVSLSLTSNVLNTKKGSLNVTLGTKIPTNDSDLASTDSEFGPEGSDFPMYYQTSLGSYDLIVGASWINDKWLFATGVQIALTENMNDFRWGQWRGYPDGNIKEEWDPYIEDYDLANNLKRGTDIMLRIERNFRFTNYNFSLGLLPIYRITKDERLDFNTGERIKIDGTTGLALSALASAGYSFNVNNGLKFIFGLKLAHRDVNPDGLTREYVLNLSYVYRF